MTQSNGVWRREAFLHLQYSAVLKEKRKFNRRQGSWNR